MQAQSETIKAARQKLSTQINQNQVLLHTAHLEATKSKHSRAVTQYANQTAQPQKQATGSILDTNSAVK